MESQTRLEPCLQAAQQATLAQLAFECGSQEVATQTTNGAEAGSTTEESFWCYSFKVVPCPLRESHDWAQCPYVHPGEKMRRRDPRKYDYTGIACSQMRQEGRCNFGDACPFAHNDPEYWLHPTRFHTAICKQGAACQRRFCFFVHHPSELRTDAPRPSISPRARALQLAAASGQLLPYGQPGAGSERGSSGSPARQRHSHDMPWLARSGSSTGSNSGRHDRVGSAAGGLAQLPLPKLEVTLARGQSSLELRAGVILRLAASAAAAAGGGGGGGGSGSGGQLLEAPGVVPFPPALVAARLDQQGSLAPSLPGTPTMVPSAPAPSLPAAYVPILSHSLGQLQLPLGGGTLVAGGGTLGAGGEAQNSWALVQTITNEVALGRLDMNQAAAILRHVLPPSELLRIELQVEGALAQH